MPPHPELVDLFGQVTASTDKAWRFFDGTRTEWLAKSLVEWEPSDAKPTYGTMTIPVWLATEKGLV